MRKIFILSLLLLFSTSPLFAQQPPNPEQIKQEMEKMRQQMEQREQEELERLRETDPKAYQKRKDFLDRQAQISEIITSFHQGKISASQAEKQLYPLVEQNIKDIDIEAEIERLEKRMEYLKKVKTDPDILIKKRIDELLGKSTPTAEDMFAP